MFVIKQGSIRHASSDWTVNRSSAHVCVCVCVCVCVFRKIDKKQRVNKGIGELSVNKTNFQGLGSVCLKEQLGA